MTTEQNVWGTVFSGLSSTPEGILRKINKHLTQRKPMYATIEKHMGTDLAGKTIVEVGAGTAIECLLFSMHNARCFAVDFEIQAMRYAKATAALFSARPHLQVGNGFAVPVKSESADLVLSQGFLEHFTESQMKDLLAEQARVLKDGGLVLVDVPNYHSSYEAYKRINGMFGNWVYGEEVGIKRKMLTKMAHSLGLEIIDSYGWSFKGYPHKSVLDFLYMLPLLVIRNILIRFGIGHDSIGLLFRKKQSQ